MIKPWKFTIMMFLITSCSGFKSCDNKPKDTCIRSFHIGYGLNNPEALVFKISASDSLKSVLLSQKWDSILLHGDILDSIKIRQETIEVSKEDSTDMLFIVGITGKLYFYSQSQLDSISERVYEKSGVSVFTKKKVWTLKPCISDSKNNK